jgi:uncharacterized RDD family membrane protein YckC
MSFSSGSVPPVVEIIPPGARGAGFWIRALALSIDGTLVGLLMLPVYVSSAFSMASDIGAGVPFTPFAFDLPFLLNVVVPWLYSAALESSPWQATVGKKICGLYVTGLGGERISFARASGRYFAKYLSMIPLNLGFVMAAFTPRNQALHDKLAGTLVWQKKGANTSPPMK